MFPLILNAFRIALPAATGPVGIIVPTLLYVIACRKVTLSIQ